MDVKISSVKENPLLGRREVEASIDHEGEKTPSEEDIVSRIAAENNLDEENIQVDGIYTGFGSQHSRAVLKVFEDFEYDEELEEETIEEEETGSGKATSGESSDIDYEEIVSSTITDAKDALGELDDPDYEKALEAEEANKDRKTFKEWLEAQ